MLSKIKALSIIMSLGVMLFGYQNCGDQVDFTSTKSGGSNTKIDDVTEITELDAEEELVELIDQLPPVDEASESPVNQENTVEDVKEVIVNNDSGNIPDLGNIAKGKDPEYYSRICSLAQFLVRNRVTTETSLSNISGYTLVGATELDKVENVSGTLIIVGVGLNSTRHIESINNVTGNKLICGMSVGSLSNSSGNTIIIKGEVGDINNHSGNLILIKSPITGSTSNVRGHFVQF